jgi:hypothetical protein
MPRFKTDALAGLSSVMRLRRWRSFLGSSAGPVTPDDSRNNSVIGFIAGGEGWHNNHHADPASARHGHHWWEVDFTWWMIRILMRLGLPTKVSLPSPNLGAKFAPAPMCRPVPNLKR